MITTYSNDFLGRVLDETVDSGVSGSSPQKQVTSFAYDGLNREISVVVCNVTPVVGAMPSTTQMQQTRYIYAARTADGSAINSDDPLSKIIYPDGTTQVDTYDALGELTTQTERDGRKHLYLYDLLGRQVADAVYVWSPGLDKTVVGLIDSYNTLGELTSAVSMGSNATIVNQVVNLYDGLGNLVKQFQSHSGPVSSPSTPFVQYTYATSYAGSSNYSRLTGVTYPGGTQVTYTYNTGLDSSISRISSVVDGSQTVETCGYLGLSTVVAVSLPESEISESTSFDNFGNVADIAWTQFAGSPNPVVTGLVNVAYRYNGVGEIVSRQDVLADMSVAGLDQVYTYDGMHRLTGYSQGTLNTTSYTLSSINASASWSLDSQGNRYDNSGTTYGTSYDATDESQSSGTAYSPGSGNTTTVTFDSSRWVIVTYDAWGRVVGTYYSPYAVGGLNGSAAYTSYSYDGAGQSYHHQEFLRGLGRRHANLLRWNESHRRARARQCHSAAHQRLVDERRPADLRDAVAAQLSADTGLTITANTSGGVIERLYALTDGLGSIVAVVGPSGTVVERYTYTADGLPQCLTSSWGVRTASVLSGGGVEYASTVGWTWFFRGQQWVQTQPDTSSLFSSSQWRGLYVSAAGVWYDPIHATTLQPNLSSYGDPPRNPYTFSSYETFGATSCSP